MKTNISVSFNESYSFVQFRTFIYGFVRVSIHFIMIRKFIVYLTNFSGQNSKCRELYKTVRNHMKT